MPLFVLTYSTVDSKDVINRYPLPFFVDELPTFGLEVLLGFLDGSLVQLPSISWMDLQFLLNKESKYTEPPICFYFLAPLKVSFRVTQLWVTMGWV